MFYTHAPFAAERAPGADECAAVSMEIVFEGTSLVGYPAGDRYRATV